MAISARLREFLRGASTQFLLTGDFEWNQKTERAQRDLDALEKIAKEEA